MEMSNSQFISRALLFWGSIVASFFIFVSSVSALTTITTCQGLQDMNLNLAEDYELGNDIDCSMTNPSDPDFDAGGTWSDNKGFEPIGDITGNTPFTGTLDGSGFIVTGLYLNRPLETGVAPISYASGATIQDIGFVGGSVVGVNQIAGLVGQALTATHY